MEFYHLENFFNLNLINFLCQAFFFSFRVHFSIKILLQTHKKITIFPFYIYLRDERYKYFTSNENFSYNKLQIVQIHTLKLVII